MLSCKNNVINEEVKNLITYIDQTIGLNLTVNPFPKNETDKLPMYLKEGYRWHKAELGGRPCVLAETVDENNFGIAQMEKHFALVRNVMGLPVIAVFYELEAYNRKRLIERKIGFIVPNKQVYIPDFFIDLKEYGITSKKERGELTPTAQLLLLHHLLNNREKERVESKAFKELAVLLGTNHAWPPLPAFFKLPTRKMSF